MEAFDMDVNLIRIKVALDSAKDEMNKTIDFLKSKIDFYEYDIEISSTPGFRYPQDIKEDRELIQKCEERIIKLNNYVEYLDDMLSSLSSFKED